MGRAAELVGPSLVSRKNSRKRQQAMNEWRREGRFAAMWMAGIPYWHKGALFIPADPQKEREEFVRQLTARRPIEPGEPEPMRGEVGAYLGMRIIQTAA